MEVITDLFDDIEARLIFSTILLLVTIMWMMVGTGKGRTGLVATYLGVDTMLEKTRKVNTQINK